MKVSQGNSLCNFLYPKQAKMPCFFYFIFFLPQNQRTGVWNKSCPGERAGISGMGRCRGKGLGGQIWCKKCVHMYVNAKMKPVETTPGIGEENKVEQ
jgi:hypothetical protein